MVFVQVLVLCRCWSDVQANRVANRIETTLNSQLSSPSLNEPTLSIGAKIPGSARRHTSLLLIQAAWAGSNVQYMIRDVTGFRWKGNFLFVGRMA